VISERYLGDESARLRFLREARAAAKVRHSNVASVLHPGKTGSSYFYAMEFVEGEILEHLITRVGRVEVKLALEIVAQAAAGLTAVSEQNLVHRDIKPSNMSYQLFADNRVRTYPRGRQRDRIESRLVGRSSCVLILPACAAGASRSRQALRTARQIA